MPILLNVFHNTCILQNHFHPLYTLFFLILDPLLYTIYLTNILINFLLTQFFFYQTMLSEVNLRVFFLD